MPGFYNSFHLNYLSRMLARVPHGILPGVVELPGTVDDGMVVL